MKRLGSMVLVLSLVLSLFSMCSFAADGDQVTVNILQTSDLHGFLFPFDYATGSPNASSGLSKVATVVKSERALDPATLLIDCGDTLQDNSAELFNNLPVHPMIQAMNLIGYDTWTLGNHEFNFGLDFVNKNVKGFQGTTLSSNIYNATTGTRFVTPYKIFDVKGVRVAVVGMTPPSIPIWEASTPDNFKNLEFKGILDETAVVLKGLEGQYDVLIGAYHDGPKGDDKFEGIDKVAAQFPQFDVIFGGHEHSTVAKEVNGVQIIEPGAYGSSVAKASIPLTKKGSAWEVGKVMTSNLLTKDIAEDADIVKAFAFVNTEALAEANKVVGTISADFIAKPDYITGKALVTTIPTAQLKDNAVIDLINDVQMYYTKADVSSAALFNFGSNLVKGDFKKMDVAFIYKYSNTLNAVNITGENLKKYMEWSATYYNTTKPGDVTVSFNPEIRGYNYDMFSGVNYKVDISKEAGSRIVSPTINGKAIDNKATYKLAINNYRFGTLLTLKLVSMDDLYYDSFALMGDAGRIRDMIIKYTADVKKGKMDPKVDNNWEITGFDFNSPYIEQVNKLVQEGKLSIPASEDGRTLNVKALNANDLLTAGLLTEVKPVVVPTPVPQVPVAPAPVVPSTKIYSVKAGDVLWRIAKMFGTTWQDLAKFNNLKNANLIFPDQSIIVPAQ